MTTENMISINEVHLESDSNRGRVVVLKENSEAERYFMMFIGDAEFAGIAKEKGLVEPKRPLTHELYGFTLLYPRSSFSRTGCVEVRGG